MSNQKESKPMPIGKDLKPRLRFPEFRDASEWARKTLSDVCKKITNGKANAEDHEEDGVYPLFDRSDVIKRSNDFAFNDEAVIIPGEGVRFHPKYYQGKFNLHQRCYALIQHKGNAKFIYYTLDYFKDALAKYAVKSTVLSLRLPIIENFILNIPRKDEQQKIANCLSSLDDLIAAENRRLDSLKTYKKGLMQQLFPTESNTMPRLRFPEFRDAGEWDKTKLCTIANIHKGKGISKDDIVPNGSHPCIRYGELYTIYGEVVCSVASRTNANILKLFLSKENDVIIPASGETKIDIAKASCVIHDNIALGGDINIVRSNQNGIFLSYLFNGPLRLIIANISQGDTVVHLYPDQIKQLEVLLPSPLEQQKIADCLSSLNELIAVEIRRLNSLKAHKKGLMQQLFPTMNEVNT